MDSIYNEFKTGFAFLGFIYSVSNLLDTLGVITFIRGLLL